MKAIPSYPKILTLGSAFTENALVGDIIIQEKLDGSQFAFGVNEDKEVVMRSKGAQVGFDNYAQMFEKAVQYIESIKKAVESIGPESYFYCEYLEKPKHNTLKYENIPTNHLCLFDAMIKGKWATREELEKLASFLGIDLIPELYRGNLGEWMLTKQAKGYSLPGDYIKRTIETTTSYLGEEIIEGAVIKNYNQTVLIGGQVFPLFTKYVRESFKERHEADWKVRQPKGALQEFVDGFKTEARWQKAVVHAKEKGLLTQSPKDIGTLIKMVQEDIKEEEAENIKQHLYKCFIDDILRKSTHGLAEYYKEKLLDNVV